MANKGKIIALISLVVVVALTIFCYVRFYFVFGDGVKAGELSNLHGDWPFLRPPEQVPEVPIVRREHLPKLEKIQEVLPSRRDEAHFR